MLRDDSVGEEASWCGVESSDTRDEKCAQLHRRLKRIVKARGALDAQEAAALREAEALRVWRHYGYSSLIEYMEIEMGYSPRMALERLRVAKAIVALPLIAQKMEQGDLSFSAARELTRVATADTEEHWVEAATDKNSQQIEELVSGHTPGDKPTDPVDPKLRTCRLRYEGIDPETKVLMRQAREIIERELGERVDDNTFLRVLARMILEGGADVGGSAPSRTKPPYQIAVTVCEQCKRGWQDGAGTTVEMAPAKLEAALCDAQHVGRVDTWESDVRNVGAANNRSGGDVVVARGPSADDVAPSAKPHTVHDVASDSAADAAASERPATAHHLASGGARARASSYPRGYESASLRTDSSATSHGPDAAPPRRPRATSSIPPALRRAVRARDHSKCRVPWCRSSRNVDQHHIVPRSEGGSNTLENLITLCESHHIAHHEGALLIEGTASVAKFTRRAHSSFAIAERAVETAGALKALGFDRHEVKAAIDKTRIHVGASELTLQQWIKIALSYCPRPCT